MAESTPAPSAPSAQLLVPTPEAVRQDLALGDQGSFSTEIDASVDLDARADNLVAELLDIDPGDDERRKAARGALESIALDEQKGAARRSAMLKQPLTDLSTRAEDGGQVATALVDLRDRVEALDPARFDFSAGALGRLLGKIPGIGTPLRRYFARYESSSRVIDDIIGSLNAGKDQLARDNITLADDQKAMRAAGIGLERAIRLGQLIDHKLEARLSRDLAGDPARSQFVREELLFPLRQRIQDLQQQLLVTQQGFLTIEMISRNNKELIRGVERGVDVTVNALQVAVTLALALAHQRITLEKVQAVTQTTNQLIAGTSSRLKQQGVEIQKQAAGTQLDMGTLRQAFADINEALADVSRYRREALPVMAQSILEMDQLAAEAERSIQHAEQAHDYAGKLSIDLGSSPA